MLEVNWTVSPEHAAMLGPSDEEMRRLAAHDPELFTEKLDTTAGRASWCQTYPPISGTMHGWTTHAYVPIWRTRWNACSCTRFVALLGAGRVRRRCRPTAREFDDAAQFGERSRQGRGVMSAAEGRNRSEAVPVPGGERSGNAQELIPSLHLRSEVGLQRRTLGILASGGKDQ